MRTARFCPVCWKAWDKSHGVGYQGMFCPVHPTVLTLQVFNYGEGFIVDVLNFEEDWEGAEK